MCEVPQNLHKEFLNLNVLFLVLKCFVKFTDSDQVGLIIRSPGIPTDTYLASDNKH